MITTSLFRQAMYCSKHAATTTRMTALSLQSVAFPSLAINPTRIMSTKIINTSKAPAAIGPYSQAVVANGFVFTAGQIPLITETMTILDGDVQAQTRLVLTNLKNVLEAAGSSFDKIVKTTVFLKVFFSCLSNTILLSNTHCFILCLDLPFVGRTIGFLHTNSLKSHILLLSNAFTSTRT